MIRIDEIKKAIRMVENPIEWLSCEAIHKQLAKSLEVYERRNEYDRSLGSAIECLSLAGYEIEDDDPTPVCSWCGSMTYTGCKCPPRAEND